MSEDHQKILKQQLWNIADTLRGKMNADEFRDYMYECATARILSCGVYQKQIQ